MTELTLENAPKSELKTMMENALHLGHQTQKWHPKIRQYIYTKKNGIHIFDLRKTYLQLQKALEYVEKLGNEGKVMLFVNTKPQAQKLIIEAAQDCECPYVDSKWFPGLLTNFKTIKARVQYFKKLEAEDKSGELEEKFLKKEVSKFKKEIEKLKDALGGVENLNKLPAALFVTDIKRDSIAVKEARKLNIPLIAITDSNTDPTLVDYPIPANDDSLRALEYIVEKIKGSYVKGKKSPK